MSDWKTDQLGDQDDVIINLGCPIETETVKPRESLAYRFMSVAWFPLMLAGLLGCGWVWCWIETSVPVLGTILRVVDRIQQAGLHGW